MMAYCCQHLRDEGIIIELNEWFRINKFMSREIADIEKLIELKRKKRKKISLVIPTLNEEATIDKTITTFKSRLIENFPLIDEIVVIDSGSSDKTEEIVRKKSVKFYRAEKILKKFSRARGKGENLWKALYVTKGDIILYVDADIGNIHPRFAYGLLGPLLVDDKIGYTKSFYRYYLKDGEAETIRGWGRMTELLIRPAINMFFPHLSGIIQPSSGQFAGRREILEKVPFFTSYGVELGLLIDIYERFGLKSIAQVDLVKVTHRHRDQEYKGKMAFGILQVLSKRADQLDPTFQFKQIRKTYRTIESFTDQDPIHYGLKKLYIEEIERPPMITVDEYLERRLDKLTQYE
jgi:glycosyltransferase involved in cell wall biosynthesis